MLLAPFGPVKKGSVIKTTYNNTNLDLGSPRLGPYAIYYLPDWQPPQNYTQRFFLLAHWFMSCIKVTWPTVERPNIE